jgi:hypothetical protein
MRQALALAPRTNDDAESGFGVLKQYWRGHHQAGPLLRGGMAMSTSNGTPAWLDGLAAPVAEAIVMDAIAKLPLDQAAAAKEAEGVADGRRKQRETKKAKADEAEKKKVVKVAKAAKIELAASGKALVDAVEAFMTKKDKDAYLRNQVAWLKLRGKVHASVLPVRKKLSCAAFAKLLAVCIDSFHAGTLKLKAADASANANTSKGSALPRAKPIRLGQPTTQLREHNAKLDKQEQDWTSEVSKPGKENSGKGGKKRKQRGKHLSKSSKPRKAKARKKDHGDSAADPAAAAPPPPPPPPEPLKPRTRKPSSAAVASFRSEDALLAHRQSARPKKAVEKPAARALPPPPLTPGPLLLQALPSSSSSSSAVAKPAARALPPPPLTPGPLLLQALSSSSSSSSSSSPSPMDVDHS